MPEAPISPVPAKRRPDWISLTAALLIGASLFALMPLKRMLAAQNDFVHWYVGGLLFGSIDIHLEGPNQEKQIELIGAVLNNSYFIRPTFYGLLLKPLTWFSYQTAYILYQTYSLLCIAFFLRVFSRRMPDLLVYAAMSVPLICNMVNGQDVTSLLLFCTLSLLLASKGWDFAGGLIFALCAIKFHLFVFVPVAMLAQKRWRLFWGAVVGEVVLFLLGLTGGGWKVTVEFIKLITRPKNHPYAELMPNLRGLTYAIAGGSTTLLAILVAAVAVATIYLIFKAPSYEKAFAYALMAGLLVGFHAYIQDPSVLLLCAPLLLDGTESKALRVTLQILLLPVSYVLLLYKAPFSATFTILLLAVLAIAVRDTVSVGALAGMRGWKPVEAGN